MRTSTRRLTSVFAAATVAAAILAPTAANATPRVAETSAATTCVVESGELRWGIKESWRSYILGSIANGNWEVSDDMAYELPLFVWSNPVGEIDADTGEGTISFTGGVHFTGHGGELDSTFSNPTIELKGDGTAHLLLDAEGKGREGGEGIDEQQVMFALVEKIAATAPSSGEYVFADAPAVLTSDGAKAFGSSYASGDALDPVSVSLKLGACEGSAIATGPEVIEEDGDEVAVVPPVEEAGQNVPWVPIVIGGVALVVTGVTAGMLFAGRKKVPGEPQHPLES